MKEKRLELQYFLEDLLETTNVYFQPPPTVKMEYPAVVYSRNDINNNFANNSIYTQKQSYRIIVIDKNPDSALVDKLSRLTNCSFERHYTNDNLNHDVFNLTII